MLVVTFKVLFLGFSLQSHRYFVAWKPCHVDLDLSTLFFVTLRRQEIFDKLWMAQQCFIVDS
jgi:hypothetical protein